MSKFRSISVQFSSKILSVLKFLDSLELTKKTEVIIELLFIKKVKSVLYQKSLNNKYSRFSQLRSSAKHKSRTCSSSISRANDKPVLTAKPSFLPPSRGSTCLSLSHSVVSIRLYSNPPQLYLFIARVLGGFIFTSYHT